MLKSEVIGPVGSGGPLETGHVICPGCAHNFTAIPENARERIAELEAALCGVMPILDKLEGQGAGGTAEFDGPVADARRCLTNSNGR